MSNRQNIEPSLRSLSFMLRHKETWPDGFEWNFMSCNHCAMGLANKMWPKTVREPTTPAMSRAFGITQAQTSIFTNGSSMGDVSPQEIADRIDQLEPA